MPNQPRSFRNTCWALISAAMTACSDPTGPSGPTKHDDLVDQETLLIPGRCGKSGLPGTTLMAFLPEGCLPIEKVVPK